MSGGLAVVYWDASAILSALIQDEYSDQAHKWSKRKGIHLLSTLSCAEVYAVLFRLQREKNITHTVVSDLIERFEFGPWQKLTLQPMWDDIKALASQRPLRGADLWHLATAITLQKEIPELVLLTFDKKLQSAAKERKLSK